MTTLSVTMKKKDNQHKLHLAKWQSAWRHSKLSVLYADCWLSFMLNVIMLIVVFLYCYDGCRLCWMSFWWMLLCILSFFFIAMLSGFMLNVVILSVVGQQNYQGKMFYSTGRLWWNFKSGCKLDIAGYFLSKGIISARGLRDF